MDQDCVDNFEVDPSSPTFALERPNGKMVYCALRCPCGGDVFRLTGWPRIVSGPGGFFWRTLTRVWREARLAMQDGEPSDSPFWLPITPRCERCGREESLLDAEGIASRMALDKREEPREAYRCRVCGRGRVEIVIGTTSGGRVDTPAAVEVIARCHGCHYQARVAWWDDPRSARMIRLDLLYGRR